MAYSQPKQQRAKQTEQRFLNALDQCLRSKSFNDTTVDEIADTAGLHRGAFLKRFGSKKGALLVLYRQYCACAKEEVARIQALKSSWASAHAVCQEASASLEQIQRAAFGCNRAMNELFMESLKTAPETKDIFLATLNLLKEVQAHFFPTHPNGNAGALGATQLLTSINYYYTLNAMPALPTASDQRHGLIASCMVAALSSVYSQKDTSGTRKTGALRQCESPLLPAGQAAS